jgi:serine phosphatase RsbU (regulator of sigma subunit)/pSer/pThr/pTyr-binding forkhead associated (FHA) protein
MPDARLEISDAVGKRKVPIERLPFTIGRRETNELRLMGSEVSRDHAELVAEGDVYLVKDRGSRYGTFVNDDQVTEHPLKHGDRIRLGRTGGAEMVFLLADEEWRTDPKTSTAIGDLRQIAALLEGLRALGSGRVLDDVLALVMDSAIEVSRAERGFIMLASPSGELEFKIARQKGRVMLSGNTFATSLKIPQEVFQTGDTRIVADLLDGDLANHHQRTVHLGIRHVLCVPLRLVRYVERASASSEEKRIGVLYLDSREKGELLTLTTRSALDTLATEAAVAIENARLYREAVEKAKLEQELALASQIQMAILPDADHAGPFYRASAATLPCRMIGGDFYDYLDLPGNLFGFALGDVAGKGPSAALLSAMMQGIFAAQAASTEGPAATVSRVNLALFRRGVEARFVTLLYGILSADGKLTYCNAGHNAPVLINRRGIQRLETGGPPAGLFEMSVYNEGSVVLEPGDSLVVFSDGVSEALSSDGREFGDDRIIACVTALKEQGPQQVLRELYASVKTFTVGAAQNDDVTALVVRYEGST